MLLHINPDQARELGIKVVNLEDDQELQNLVLTLHHAYTHALTQTLAVKIIENHKGIAHENMMQATLVAVADGRK